MSMLGRMSAGIVTRRLSASRKCRHAHQMSAKPRATPRRMLAAGSMAFFSRRLTSFVRRCAAKKQARDATASYYRRGAHADTMFMKLATVRRIFTDDMPLEEV